MPSDEGWGGFFTTVGLVNGPFKCRGVLVEELLNLVGGITPEDTLWVSAPDGYTMVYSYEQVKGDFITYAPETLKEVPCADLKMLLMYEQDRAFLTEDGGKPFRLALVSKKDKILSEGHYWVKWINKMEVRKGLQEEKDEQK